MTDSAIVRQIRAELAFSEMFIARLLRRTSCVEEDLVDQLFNSSEERLARLLLLLANFGKESKPETIIAKISQETLAEMVGTTRSGVSFFMNKLRKLGLIAYNGDAEGGIEVHSSLLNVVLHDNPKLRPKCSNSSVLNAPHCPVHPNDTSRTVPNFGAVTRNNYVHSREPHPWRMCYN